MNDSEDVLFKWRPVLATTRDFTEAFFAEAVVRWVVNNGDYGFVGETVDKEM